MNVNVDVFAVTKIKVDQSFPPVQFLFNGSDNPYRLDVNGKVMARCSMLDLVLHDAS